MSRVSTSTIPFDHWAWQGNARQSDAVIAASGDARRLFAHPRRSRRLSRWARLPSAVCKAGRSPTPWRTRQFGAFAAVPGRSLYGRAAPTSVTFADGVNKLRKLSNYSTVLPQLRMNEPARWTTLLRLAEVCSRWWLSIRAGAEHQAWRQRLAIQARAVYAPDWRERLDRCGADGRDTGALQLTGDLVAQRLGDIQVSVVHDARRPEE